VLATVSTPSLTVVGDIRLPLVESPGTSYHFRLLDLLNNPRLGMLISGQQAETILIENPILISEHGDTVLLGQRLHVRPEHIAYILEYENPQPDTPLQYNPRQFPKEEQLSILTSTGTRINGTFLGGTGLLASGTTKRFLFFSRATVQDLRILGAQLHAPFVIVNHEAIVAFSSFDELKG